MRFQIAHEIRGRLRIRLIQKQLSLRDADILQYGLSTLPGVSKVKVSHRSGSAVICYHGGRDDMIRHLRMFHGEEVSVPEDVVSKSGRVLSDEYYSKLVSAVAFRGIQRFLFPFPLQRVVVVIRSLKYIREGVRTLLKRRIEVPVLDAAAIGASILRSDFQTAGSIMFLLGVGEILEEWTHKKSVGDLARSMSLNVSKVWLKTDDGEVLVSGEQIHRGDEIVVHMGGLIPFDGHVTEGEAMINQASMTGESLPVRKKNGSYVYAGTVVEEGELTIRIDTVSGSSRYEKIIKMIEDSEKMKSALESRASHLADTLVPYTFAGSALTWLLTRNAMKAVSVLMVDFSCALKLAMPISVLSAIREASNHAITVKGGKFLEAVADAQTILFDKTGTLTKAKPTVARVIPFGTEDADECLRIAACLEEHFPHSIARAVVDAAQEKGLVHEEMHAKVEYIVAHGIATSIDGKRAVIGSYHFVFEDEKCVVPEGGEERFASVPEEYSHLYLAREGALKAVICIEDPVRPEAAEVIRKLKERGIEKTVMMTGDSERTARAIAGMTGMDAYYAEVLPEDKAGFVEAEKARGKKVIMIGDGINDSPALSCADAGVAISDGAEIAREIADVIIGADDLEQIVLLRDLSEQLMKRIHTNYRVIVGFNAGLILLGVFGILTPTASALLHNTSTILISLGSMRNLLPPVLPDT